MLPGVRIVLTGGASVYLKLGHMYEGTMLLSHP